MKYRKKPVVIEAIHFIEKPIPEEAWNTWVMRWVDEMGGDSSKWLWGKESITIPTLEGDMIARWGDYIICGVNGEFYPCKPDIFEKTYERVDE